MSSLSALLKNNSAEKSPDDEKLMDLYWNRNELKKEFADLRDEKFRLHDKIKKQDGAIARLQQKLDHIEELMIDPEWARNTLVHYQLRGMGLRCQRKLARFAEQLKQQREQKQQSQVMSGWQQGIEQEKQALQLQILSQKETILQLEDQLLSENRRLGNMGGIVRLFKGRSVSSGIDDLVQQIHLMTDQGEELQAQFDEIGKREPPDNAGLDLATKRSINYMILSFAQQLYILFDDDELATFVREAGEKSAGAIKYGDEQDCENVLARLRHSTETMEKSSDFAEVLQRRAKLISERAVFQDDNDAVPAPGTVATLYRVGQNEVVTEGDANILGDNYWGIAGFLSR